MRSPARRVPGRIRCPACRLRLALVVLATLLWWGALLHPRSAQAQQTAAALEVVVTDSLGRPLEGARVSLDGTGPRGLTDSAGELRITMLPAGSMVIVVHLFGYRPDSSTVQLAAGRRDRVQFALEAEPIPVAGVRVEVTGRRDQLDFLRGFHERRDRGIGYFLTREEIEESGTSDLSNLLHMVPGLRTSPSQFGQSRMRAVRTPITRQCEIKVYLDGMKYRSPSDLPGIPTSDIEGIEVYRGRSELPAEFADIDTNCGAIVIWSRRHR